MTRVLMLVLVFLLVPPVFAGPFDFGRRPEIVPRPHLAPNGQWVDGDPHLAPDGETWVGGMPHLAPDGEWVGSDEKLYNGPSPSGEDDGPARYGR